jgi:RimJ/RimL family protein N-acetyltransferase
MARASIAAARAQQGFATVVACVDEPNVASMRVLEKVGFRRVAILPGHFGCQFLLELDGNDGSRPQAWEAGLAGPAIPPDPAGDPPER